MIIWLASYPRSGNTLLRLILKTCFGLPSSSVDGDGQSMFHPGFPQEREIFWEFKATERKPWNFSKEYRALTESADRHLVKTHLPPPDEQPSIQIIRDGRAACLSYFHFHRGTQPGASRTLEQILVGDDWYGDWTEHYRLWSAREPSMRLVLRYEELVNASPETLARIAAYVGYDGPIRPWKNLFPSLQSANPVQFRQGSAVWTPPPEWIPEIDAIFWELHGSLMKELGYGERPASLAAAATWKALVQGYSALAKKSRMLQQVCDDRAAVIADRIRTPQAQRWNRKADA